MVLLLSGCGRDQIKVYSVPKEKVAMAASDDEGGAPRAIQWKLPDGWQEQQAGGMRVARFSVPGKDGHEADVSIIPLARMAASKEDVVNLWREQIHLGPVRSEDLPGEKVPIGQSQGELFDMVSTEPLINETNKARILVAMLVADNTTWFFKMKGEDEQVRREKPAFLSFLKSISFEESTAPARPPRFTSTNVKEVPAGRPAGKPAWNVPSGWKETPPTQMLLAKFLISASDGKAEVTVSAFPGDMGGLLANVNRWRGQVGLAPIAQAEAERLVSSLDVPGGKAMLLDMSGQNKAGQQTRLIGAIVPRDGQTWFYKLMGDDPLAGREKTAFIQFLQSVKYPDA